ncbi:hypothetical protein V8F20_012312 [Naviculisporaceae sp. PSN 640]
MYFGPEDPLKIKNCGCPFPAGRVTEGDRDVQCSQAPVDPDFHDRTSPSHGGPCTTGAGWVETFSCCRLLAGCYGYVTSRRRRVSPPPLGPFLSSRDFEIVLEGTYGPAVRWTLATRFQHITKSINFGTPLFEQTSPPIHPSVTMKKQQEDGEKKAAKASEMFSWSFFEYRTIQVWRVESRADRDRREDIEYMQRPLMRVRAARYWRRYFLDSVPAGYLLTAPRDEADEARVILAAAVYVDIMLQDYIQRLQEFLDDMFEEDDMCSSDCSHQTGLGALTTCIKYAVRAPRRPQHYDLEHLDDQNPDLPQWRPFLLEKLREAVQKAEDAARDAHEEMSRNLDSSDRLAAQTAAIERAKKTRRKARWMIMRLNSFDHAYDEMRDKLGQKKENLERVILKPDAEFEPDVEDNLQSENEFPIEDWPDSEDGYGSEYVPEDEDELEEETVRVRRRRRRPGEF